MSFQFVTMAGCEGKSYKVHYFDQKLRAYGNKHMMVEQGCKLEVTNKGNDST